LAGVVPLLRPFAVDQLSHLWSFFVILLSALSAHLRPRRAASFLLSANLVVTSKSDKAPQTQQCVVQLGYTDPFGQGISAMMQIFPFTGTHVGANADSDVEASRMVKVLQMFRRP
ncbi:MAG: hypothetical protein ABW043_21615, partial [Devosia sp.]|uniref:hypothetical protein n=1 Tax=Devosia sp. TaxID=1871048 RepID=UPI0033915E78